VQERHPEFSNDVYQDPETGGFETLAEAISEPAKYSPNGTLREIPFPRRQSMDWEF
jgi:hypothetical protein